MSKMFKDRSMMEHPIYSVSELDFKLTDYPLFVRCKSYHHHKFISDPATPGIFMVFTELLLKRI